MGKMLDALETAVVRDSEVEARWIPDVRLLLHLPSRREVFWENMRDLIHPPQLPELHLRSAPAPFWQDVFVEQNLPWRRFLQSGGYHILALALLLAAVRYLPSTQHALPPAEFHHDQVVYYAPSEYLPPIDTRRSDSPPQEKADPAPARQPIISLPREADNRSQTIVTAPSVKLDHDVPLPNIVSWNDPPKMPVGPAPLIAASERERIAPQMENSVVAPPPDPARLKDTREAATVESAILAPPPSVDTAARRMGDINIAPSAVIAPAPRLAVDSQRALPGSVSAVAGKSGPVVPPPPSVAGSASGGTGQRMIALNLLPAIAAPPSSAPGNRRGAFAATPDARAGASGAPGPSGHGSSNQPGPGAAHSSDLPAGLYVGKAANPTAAVAGDPPAANSSPTNSATNVPPAGVRPSSRPAQPASATNLTEQERAVFAERKLYAMTLNTPNLNSAGGTWIVRFAELKKSSSDSAQLYAPAVVRKVDPAYPLELMHENVGGTVILYAVIHADGTVGNVRVLRAVDDRLDHFAAQAIRQWQFQPAVKNGVAIDVEATFHIPFKPARSDF
jgi:TonB family protein